MADLNTSLLKRLSIGLDDDQAIVWPETYKENPLMYDQVCGEAYVVRDKQDGSLDWMWASSFERQQKANPNLEIVTMVYIVRKRLPWNDSHQEWLFTQDEMEEHRGDFDVLETFVYVRDREADDNVILVDKLEFEEDRSRYEVVEVRYLVQWLTHDPSWSLGIDPNTIQTYMSM